jgi:hypothetical protein
MRVSGRPGSRWLQMTSSCPVVIYSKVSAFATTVVKDSASVVALVAAQRNVAA